MRTTSPVSLRPDTHLQVDLVDSIDVVCHPSEDETAHARRDADAHEQNFFTGIWSKTLLHMLHLWTIKEADEHSCLMALIQCNFLEKKHIKMQERKVQTQLQWWRLVQLYLVKKSHCDRDPVYKREFSS